MSSRIEIYTQPNCPLCDEAKEKLAFVCNSLNLTFSEIDIHNQDSLLEAYLIRVPVIKINGHEIAEGNVYMHEIEDSVKKFCFENG